MNNMTIWKVKDMERSGMDTNIVTWLIDLECWLIWSENISDEGGTTGYNLWCTTIGSRINISQRMIWIERLYSNW